MNIFEHINSNWQYILSMLHENLNKSSFEYGALLRKREIKSASDLLRLIFTYSWGGFSLRDTAAWAKQSGIAKVSDVALLERFKNSAAWMGFLLTEFLAQRTKLRLQYKGLRIRIADATSVTRPGSKGADWRVHIGFDLEYLRCDHIELTDKSIGESLSRIPVQSGEVLVGDRIYGRRSSVYAVVSGGGDVIVRLSISHLPLMDSNNQRIDILKALGNLELKPGDVADIEVKSVPDKKNGIPSIKGRMIAKRKIKEDTEKARAKLIYERKRKGKKVSEESLQACEYIILFTTLGDNVPAEDILEIYRFRWQVEMAFKRMKSLIHLDEMAAKNDELCRTFILGKLLAVLLVEDLIHNMGSFPPCGGKWEEWEPTLAYV